MCGSEFFLVFCVASTNRNGCYFDLIHFLCQSNSMVTNTIVRITFAYGAWRRFLLSVEGFDRLLPCLGWTLKRNGLFRTYHRRPSVQCKYHHFHQLLDDTEFWMESVVSLKRLFDHQLCTVRQGQKLVLESSRHIPFITDDQKSKKFSKLTLNFSIRRIQWSGVVNFDRVLKHNKMYPTVFCLSMHS